MSFTLFCLFVTLNGNGPLENHFVKTAAAEETGSVPQDYILSKCRGDSFVLKLKFILCWTSFALVVVGLVVVTLLLCGTPLRPNLISRQFGSWRRTRLKPFEVDWLPERLRDVAN